MYSGFEMFIAFLLGGFTSISIIGVIIVINLLKLLLRTLLDSIDDSE